MDEGWFLNPAGNNNLRQNRFGNEEADASAICEYRVSCLLKVYNIRRKQNTHRKIKIIISKEKKCTSISDKL